MSAFITEIKKFIVVGEKLESDLIKNFQLKKLQKNELIVKEGQYRVPLSFVKTGVLRCFNLKNEKDVTNDFFLENTFVTDFEALIKRSPAKQNFQAIENAEVYVLSTEKLFQLTKTYPEIREWGAKMAENLFSNLLGNNSMLKSASPEERYLKMLKEKPIIIQRIPLHYVASYLGITQVHLSRIRKKVH